MELGILFFARGGAGASGGSGERGGLYRLLLEAVRFADREGFCAVWTPERHFHEFGGLFPSPAVLSGALAVLTERIQIRAGSLISPLHQDLRIAEEWSVVDNLSAGRVAISFGSGWNVDDFLFFPERYAGRHEVMARQIDTVRRLWRGEEVVRDNSLGKPVRVTLHPRPVQPELPVWLTSSGNVATFVNAARLGANVLTHLIGQDVVQLGDKIARYRAELQAAFGGTVQGKVSLMLHTYLDDEVDAARLAVRAPLRDYLRSALSLEQLAMQGGGVVSGGHQVAAHDILADDMAELLERAVDRYLRESSLIGTVESCRELLWRLEEIGVDEIACLIDFMAEPAAILASLKRLATLRALAARAADSGAAASAAAHFSESLD